MFTSRRSLMLSSWEEASAKFGALRAPDGVVGFDARPAPVKNFLAYSLRRLGTGHVEIYRPARVDPAVPIEDTVGAIAELIQAGHVRHLGLSEVGVATLRRARHTPGDGSADRILADGFAASKPRSCPLAASSASASLPTGCCCAACSAVA